MSASGQDVWTIGKLLGWTTEYFTSKGVDSPRLDAEVLLGHVLNSKRIQLYAMYDNEVGTTERGRFKELIQKRASGTPVAYLTGEREFYGLNFQVSSAVLIPRPETEHLVGAAIAWLKPLPSPRFLELGIGSGAITLTIAAKVPAAVGVGCDLSVDAIAIAKKNAELLGVADRVTLVESDLFAGIQERDFDLIVSNPPYVATDEWDELPVDVREHEPRLALFAGERGLDVYRRLIPDAVGYLRPGGRLMLEIGYRQEADVAGLFSEADWTLLPTIRDYSDHPRVIVAERKS